jgi:hypothetical protein
MFSQETSTKEVPRKPLTRSTTRQLTPMTEGASQTHVHHATKAPVHQDPVEIIETQSPPDASNQTIKRLRNLLKDAQVQIVQFQPFSLCNPSSFPW